MKRCTFCKGELKRSKKNPDYLLCYRCKKKFYEPEEPELDEDCFENVDILSSPSEETVNTTPNNSITCPNCGSQNIRYQREQAGQVGAATNTVVVKDATERHGCLYWLLFGWWYWIFIGWWWRLLFGGGTHGGLNVGGSKAIYSTVAICQDCGNTWKVRKHQNNPSGLPNIKSCLGVVIGVIFALCVLSSIVKHLGGNSDTTTEREETDNISTVQESEVADYGNIEDFDYELSENGIILSDYNGKTETLEIQTSYTIDGTEYKTDISDFIIRSDSVKTLILDEGFTETDLAIFNSCKAEKIYYPTTMTVVYDYSLAYLHSYDSATIEIYYGGTEDEWDNIFTEYERQSLSETESEEEWGESTAAAVNNFVGHEYDSSLFEYHFSANPEDLK